MLVYKPSATWFDLIFQQVCKIDLNKKRAINQLLMARFFYGTINLKWEQLGASPRYTR